MSPLAGLRQKLASHTEMSSARKQNTVPAVPGTLNAGNYEMDEYSDRGVAAPHTAPGYTPYLGLRARLSQVWINRWTVLLLLIVARLLLAIKDINHSIDSAKTEALSACTSVEKAGSSMASMPHYLSRGVNALAADGITRAVSGLMSMVLLTVTGVEEIILFWINMMTSTYVCLITLVIGGSAHVALNMIEKVGDFMKKSIEGLTGDLAKDAGKFQDTLNGFLDKLSVPAGLFGGSKTPPKIDLSSGIAKLNDIKIDTSQMNAELDKLNASIPDFKEVHEFTDKMIRLPFEEIKKLINESLPAYKFDHSVFPVAQKKALSFCSGNSKINDFFTHLFEVIQKAKIVFLVVLILAAVLVCIPMAWMEIQRWRRMQQHAQLVNQNSFDPMDVIHIASRPFTSRVGIKISGKFKNPKKQLLMRWFVAYATSIPALFLLSLGIAGLFSCLCQYIVLKAVEKEVPAIADQVGDFADDVVFALNNASTDWAVESNKVIASTGAKVNEDLFGWVKTSTKSVNDTLNVFTDKMTEALNVTFGGTVLYDPVKELMNCLIGLKIAGIEKGLTWVHDHAHIDFPEFRPDVFSLGAIASRTNSTADDSFLAAPGDVAGDGITNAVVKISNKLQEGLKTEAFISLAIIGLWVFLVLIGLTRVLIAMMGRDKTRAEGGAVGYGEDTVPLSPKYTRNNPSAAVFPRFGRDSEESDGVQNEKLGVVGGGRGVPGMVGGHERSSSYGYVMDEKR
ncbi:hypothetical protein HYFRA_00009122 [Hymenoscyphus fraxineus]|uniref:Plasma membrane fusion protein PRM1 n=1 Tax=Hymenoscyphus fraxineus TaxID=746836 RepID=A0A9N9PTZ8_9HELO|nr:hypothetical protein HYFRA_00009122 [Hymenoscyphus fraxineus]